MFEALSARAARTAERGARQAADRLAAALVEELPGVEIEVTEAGVRISGRRLGATLSWTMMGLLR